MGEGEGLAWPGNGLKFLEKTQAFSSPCKKYKKILKEQKPSPAVLSDQGQVGQTGVLIRKGGNCCCILQLTFHPTLSLALTGPDTDANGMG